MRDPERIDAVLAAIREVWVQHPDMRLGQIIASATRKCEPCPTVFYVEDAELVKKIQDQFVTARPA